MHRIGHKLWHCSAGCFMASTRHRPRCSTVDLTTQDPTLGLWDEGKMIRDHEVPSVPFHDGSEFWPNCFLHMSLFVLEADNNHSKMLSRHARTIQHTLSALLAVFSVARGGVPKKTPTSLSHPSVQEALGLGSLSLSLSLSLLPLNQQDVKGYNRPDHCPQRVTLEGWAMQQTG